MLICLPDQAFGSRLTERPHVLLAGPSGLRVSIGNVLFEFSPEDELPADWELEDRLMRRIEQFTAFVDSGTGAAWYIGKNFGSFPHALRRNRYRVWWIQAKMEFKTLCSSG